MGKLSGKVAVVTGAGGIGRAIVDALAAEGADIGLSIRMLMGPAQLLWRLSAWRADLVRASRRER